MANDYVIANGTTCYHVDDYHQVYANGVLVFDDTLHLTLPASGTTVNLETFVKANNPHNRHRKAVITNSGTRGPVITGNLASAGFEEVELINNGEIQANVQSGDALTLTSNLKLKNNGWIRGAGGIGGKGGNGGNGGNGGKGGKGGKGKDTSGSSTATQTKGDVACFGSAFFFAPGATIAGQAGSGALVVRWDGHEYYQIGDSNGPFGLPGISGTFTRGSYITTMTCGYQNGSFATSVHQIIRTYSVSSSFTGGAGGAGGSVKTNKGYGKAGGAGGRGRYYGYSNLGGTGGTYGSYGTSGNTGSNGSASSPSGGNSGGKGGTAGTGGRGGRGGTGGTGGTWGANGNYGNTGATGSTGSKGSTGARGGGSGDYGSAGSNGYGGSGGSGGSAGGAAGKSIRGTSKLISGSSWGNRSGSTVS